MLLEDGGELKGKDRWIKESETMMQTIMEIATGNDLTMDGACEKNEKMIKMEIAISNVLEDFDTHEWQDYLDYLSNIHLWLNRV